MGIPMSTPDYEKEQQIIVCRKAREIKKLRLSEDRISVLPEEILLHILSFVPTKFAIQTCIQLSKQWKPLWTSIPCLSFDIEDDNGLRFFNKVLHENKSPWIHKFRVDCSGNSTIPSSSDLESWIKEAVSRKAREIDLVITTCRVLLNSIITCETLVVLRLSGGGRFMDIIAGQEWKPSFPNLKTMVLHSVMFYGEKTFNTLVSCCPELENLSFRSVHWILGKRFVVNARKLKNLEIVLPFTVNQVQEYEINAPSLEFLDITDCVSYSVSFTNVGCLKKANVRLVNSTSCKSFLNCFKEFRNLESLSLSNPSSNTPRLNNIFTSTSLLAGVELLNLRRLELGSGWYGLLQYILFCSPNLRVLRLVKDLKAATCASLPTIKSSLSQLKVVEIEHLCDTKHNLDTLKYILRNGTMLEMVRIRIHGIEPEPLCNKDFSTRAGGRPREFEEKFLKSEQKCHELERKMRIQQEISGFSRGSTACRVTYY